MSDELKPGSDDAPQRPLSRSLGQAHEPDHAEDFWDLDGEGDEGGFLAPGNPFLKGDAPAAEAGNELGHPARIEPRLIGHASDLVRTDVPHEEPRAAVRRVDPGLAEVMDEFAALEGSAFESFEAKPEEVPAGPQDAVAVSSLADAVAADDGILGDELDGDESAADEEGFLADPTELAPELQPLGIPKTFGEWVACVARLSVLEKVCILLILLLVSGFAAVMFFPAIDDLPDEKRYTETSDLPIGGALVKVVSAEMYWREPVKEGPNADIFRRESVLLPVLEIKVDGGPGVVRVLFRGEKGAVVGDPVTRQVDGSAVLNLVGTTGFTQQGMYAAYRAGQIEPWTVQVFEAPSVNAPSDQFKLLFEMKMSAGLR